MRIDRNLVLCDAMPGYLYARALQRELPHHLRSSVTVEQAIHQGNNPVAIMKEALRRKQQSLKERDPYQKIWVLSKRPNCADGRIATLINDNGLDTAYCPLCMEQWYMLHFEDYDPHINTDEAAVSRLLSVWPGYKKNGVDAYGELKDRLPVAVERAELVNRSVPSLLGDGEPVFTIQRLLLFFTSLQNVA